MRNGRLLFGTMAVFLACIAGAAFSATNITWLNTYDHDNDSNTAEITKEVGTAWQWFDANNWSGGVVPMGEGQNAKFVNWHPTFLDGNASTDYEIVDLAGGVVDLVGTGVDPGNLTIEKCYSRLGSLGPGGVKLIDSSVGKTSSIKVNLYNPRYRATNSSEVPVTCEELRVDYRGSTYIHNAALDANHVNVGTAHVIIEQPASGTVNIKSAAIYVDGSPWQTWNYTPELVINSDVTGLTTVTMAADIWGDYEANGDGALGTGTVDCQSGSISVGAAQSVFPAVTLGENCSMGGNLTGATYGVGGNVSFHPGVILGDTSGGANNPTRAQAGGATLYMPVATVSSGTIISGDDGISAYKGVGIGRWSDSDTVGATIQALASSGDLEIGVAGREVFLGPDTTLRGDGTSTTANIKVFPGAGQITLNNGAINGNATGSDLITTINIDGVAGDKSPAIDKMTGTDRYVVLKTSGTGQIAAGQTVKVTNGVYQMDTGGAVDTIAGTLVIGPGGTLDMVDSSIAQPPTVPAGVIQAAASGQLEVQDRAVLKLPAGDSLGVIGTDASRVAVSGTPMVCFSRADDSYYDKWVAEVTIDAASNPGLQKILDQSDIILHSSYHVYSNTDRRTKFLGDGLNIRDGGMVTAPWHVWSNPAADTGVHQDSAYFGPAADGGSFTIASPAKNNMRIYCPTGSASKRASTIYVGSDSEIETIGNTGWYPYITDMGRVSGLPTGNTTFYNTIYADQVVAISGALTLDGAAVADGGVNVISQSAPVTVQNGTFTSGKLTVGANGYVYVKNTCLELGDVTINSGYTSGSSGLRVDSSATVVHGRLSGSGAWGQAGYIQLGAGATVAAGSNEGADIGTINDGGKGLWFQDNAIIEWQVSDRTQSPATAGHGYDVIFGTTFDFAVTSEADAILGLNIIDAGLTEDIQATDKFALVVVQGNGAIDIPTGTWALDITAPADWDTSGVYLAYDDTTDYTDDGVADKVVYLTGLSSSLTAPGDANGDGVADAADYIIWKQNVGNMTGNADQTMGDFNGDGNVTVADLVTLNTAMNGAVGQAVTPEPATLALLAFGGLAVVRRRRK